MTFGVGHITTLTVNILFKTLILPVIDKKNNQSLVSDADREIPTLGSTNNAGNLVNLDSGIILFPRVQISRSASETDDRFFFSLTLLTHVSEEHLLSTLVMVSQTVLSVSWLRVEDEVGLQSPVVGSGSLVAQVGILHQFPCPHPPCPLHLFLASFSFSSLLFHVCLMMVV